MKSWIKFSNYILIYLTCISCSQHDFEPVYRSERYVGRKMEEYLKTQPKSEHDFLISKRNAALTLTRFLKLEGNVYKLEISEREAQKIGISRSLYKLHAKELEELNLFIRGIIDDGLTVELEDPQEAVAAYDNPKIHTNIEKSKRSKDSSRTLLSETSGMIITNSSSPGEDVFKRPSSGVNVIFVCSAPTMIAVAYTCSVIAGGKTETVVRSGITYRCKSIPVKIPSCSPGDNVTVRFSTNTRSGGTSVWSVE